MEDQVFWAIAGLFVGRQSNQMGSKGQRAKEDQNTVRVFVATRREGRVDRNLGGAFMV